MNSILINTQDKELIMLRDISSAFSRSAFTDILNFNDYSHLEWLTSNYSFHKITTYNELLKNFYSIISKKYRCEYVYKNELIKKLLYLYGSNNTIYFNEFKVGNSIADIAMFNGESKAFEIKTEYDSPRRLNKQMTDYKRLFDKCYIVIPERMYEEYNKYTDSTNGIIVLKNYGGHITLQEIRHATQNSRFDTEMLMSCLRTEEYTNIVKALGFNTENIPGYDMFKYCHGIFKKIDSQKLKSLFLQEIKKRKNNTRFLKKYPMPLRQMMLSLNLSEKKANLLLEKLNTNI